MKAYLVILLTILFSLNTNLIYCQDDLSIFDDFTGKKWIGHYQNSEDSNIVHIIVWQYELNEQVVKEVKTVPGVDFQKETYFFWDFESNQISFLSLMNKALISKGYVTKNNGKLELKGKTFFKDGFQEFKQVYEITGDGKLKDYFFRKSNDKWMQGHFIKYTSCKVGTQERKKEFDEK